MFLKISLDALKKSQKKCAIAKEERNWKLIVKWVDDSILEVTKESSSANL
jgi:hypothetical protein